MSAITKTLARVELWDTIEADGGSRLRFFAGVVSANDTYEVGSTEELTVVVTRDLSYWDDLAHDSVVRTVDVDGEYDEWRIRQLTDGQDAKGKANVTILCDSIKFDLVNNAEIMERAEMDGSAATHFEYYGLTPAEHIAVILTYAESYFTVGTIQTTDPVDMIYHDDTPLSALMELATITDTELSVSRDGTTSYRIDLVDGINVGGDVLEIRNGGNLISAKRTTDSRDMGTRVYVRGGQTFGREGTLAGAAWPVASQVTGTIQFVDEIMSENDQLNGYYVIDKDGFAREITDSVAPSTIVTAITISIPDDYRLSLKRQYTDPISGTIIYIDLTYLELPSAVTEYGIKPALLERSDIPGINNYVVNPLLSKWEDANTPSGYEVLGNATIDKNTSSLYTRHGGASAFILALPGDGIVTQNIRIIPTEANPFIAAQAQLFVADNGITGVTNGHVRMEITELVTGLVFPPPDQPAETLTEGGWIDSFGVNPGAEPDDNWYTRMIEANATSLVFRVSLICAGNADVADVPVAAFFLDAIQLTRTPSFTEVIYGGFASNDLWKLGMRALDGLSTPAESYDVAVIDFKRLDPDNYTINEIVIGGDVRIVDTVSEIDFSTRTTSIARNLLVEGDTKITVEDISNDLSRILGASNRRTRAPVDTKEGGDAQLPPSSDTNVGAGPDGENCSEFGEEHCSPDSAGALDIHTYTSINLEDNSIAIGSDIAWGYQGKVTATDAGTGGEANPEGTMKRTTIGAVFYQDGYDRDNLDIANFIDLDGTWEVKTVTDPSGRSFKILTCQTGLSYVKCDMTAIGDMAVFYRVHWEPAWQNAICVQQDAQGDQISPIARLEYDATQKINYGYYIDRDFGPATANPCGIQRTDQDKEVFKAIAGTDTSLIGPVTSNHGQTEYTTYGGLIAFDGDIRATGPGGVTGSSSDGGLNGRTGVAGFSMVQGFNLYNGISVISVVEGLDIVCSGLPTGYFFGLSGSTAVEESGGTATVTFPTSLYVPYPSVRIWDGDPTLNGSVASEQYVFGDNAIDWTDKETSTVQATAAPASDDTYFANYEVEIGAPLKTGFYYFRIELQVNIDGGGYEVVDTIYRSGTAYVGDGVSIGGRLSGVIAGVDTDDTWKVLFTEWGAASGHTLDGTIGPLSHDYVTTVITEMANFSPSTGVFPDDIYIYDSTGALEDDSADAVFAAVDLEFYDSGDTLVSETNDDGVKSPDYTRGTGTTVIPATTAYITPVARRKGAGQGIACVKELMVNLGTVAAEFRPCDLEALEIIPEWRVPIGMDLVAHYAMDDFKYPKLYQYAVPAGSFVFRKNDPDGIYLKSRQVWDSSSHRNHLTMFPGYYYDYGPTLDGDTGDHPNTGVNPHGDWVFDWGFPYEGISGWGWFRPENSKYDILADDDFASWMYLSENSFIYDPYPLDNIDYGSRGQFPVMPPVGPDFNKMYDFTYVWWIRPTYTDDNYWSWCFASVFNGVAQAIPYVITDEIEITDTSVYKWTSSGSGTNEYYLEALAGGPPPNIHEPWAISTDRYGEFHWHKGTAGSLTDHEFGWGDNDSLGFQTIYVADATGNPETLTTLYVTNGVQLNDARAGWRFVYSYVKGSEDCSWDFNYVQPQFAHTYESISFSGVWPSGGAVPATPADLYHGVEATSPGNIGHLHDEWSFVALRVKRTEGSTVGTIKTDGYAGGGGATKDLGYDNLSGIATKYTPTADMYPRSIRVLTSKVADEIFQWNKALEVRIYEDSSGAFGTLVGVGVCGSAHMVDASDTEEYVEFAFSNSVIPVNALRTTSSYWVVFYCVGSPTGDSDFAVRLHGTDPGSASFETRSLTGAIPGTIGSTITFDPHFEISGYEVGVGEGLTYVDNTLNLVDVDVYIGRPSTGDFTKLADHASITVDNLGIDQPKEVIGNNNTIWATMPGYTPDERGMARGYSNAYCPKGVMDESKRWNRPLTDEEIRGEFMAGSPLHKSPQAIAGFEQDVDGDTGADSAEFRDIHGTVPVGAIVAWHKSMYNTVALPENFLECDGSVIDDAESPFNGMLLPDLDGGGFLKGAASSGSTSTGDAATGSAAIPSMTVVWVMRIK